MDNPLETVEIARRVLNLFFIIDCSGSMSGVKMGTVNTAIREMLPELQRISAGNADAEIKMSVLAFSGSATWSILPTPVDSLVWNDLAADGGTDIGDAFRVLNANLSTKGFMTSASGSYAPVEILMSDGQPTEPYKECLADLQNNKWHQVAVKAAIAIGEDADQKMLAEFTGNPELVLTASTPETLNKIIRFVSITSSKVSSQSSCVGTKGSPVQQKQAVFAQQVQDFKDSNPDIDSLSDGF